MCTNSNKKNQLKNKQGMEPDPFNTGNDHITKKE